MVLRTCISLLIGAVCGALLGATSFAVADHFFGRDMVFGKSPVWRQSLELFAPACHVYSSALLLVPSD
jgi:hypothetical protein